MKINNILDSIYCYQGNFIQNDKNKFISSENFIKLIELLNQCEYPIGLLITPFLINEKNGQQYELHYYEFEIEIAEEKSHYIEYPIGNLLPKEIIISLKPKAIISAKDKVFYMQALIDYYNAMKEMTFEQDKNIHKILHNSKLFFQIY